MHASAASPRFAGNWTDVLTAMGEPLLFGVRLWASVCLALFFAFWLQLDNPFWAGTSAAIVCQPQLGASLRKGWFRMIGTVVGAITIVVLTACFPQDRIAFLLLLALWAAFCAFAATLLRNFASYSAALAGYTAAIIAADTLGATGGPNTEVFMLAVTRASEICIGIVCAGIVLAGTDLGGAQQRLAASLASLTAGITSRFTSMLAEAGREMPDTQHQRREFVRRVIALDPEIDQAIGESSDLRYHSSTLQAAVRGLFTALDGWRGVATHLSELPDNVAQQGAECLLDSLRPPLRSAPSEVPTGLIADPIGLRRVCETSVQRLLALPAGTPSLRLLADEMAKLLTGILDVLDGLALLVDPPGRPRSAHRPVRRSVPDWLPAIVNAGRALVITGAVEVFWIVTAWPNGALAITFTAIVVLLLSPRGELAYAGALALTLGTAAAIICAAVIKFAVLPGLQTFPAFCAAIGLYLIPIGFWMAQNRQPAMLAVLSAMTVNFMPVLSPTNQMSYDTAQFYNVALAIFFGCAAAALSFELLPPLSPALRTRRLLAFALTDLRHLAISSSPPPLDDWEKRMYDRLAALPDTAEPVQRAQLLAALAVGREIAQLRLICALLGLSSQLDAALAALMKGRSEIAVTQVARLDRRLASLTDEGTEAHLALRARARILVLAEALAQHADYFDAGLPP
jgi:uncharacterized membrane protein YccC